VIQVFVFYLFATLVIASGVMTIASRNPVHSVLWLIFAFFNAAGLFLLIGAEFLAFLLVIVYVGAVAVLFLFVVMMLDIDVAALRAGFWKHFPVAATVGALIALEMAAVLMGGFRPEEPRPMQAAQAAVQAGVQYSNTKELGKLLYSQYLFPLEIAAVILLVAIVAAIALTLRQRKDSRHMDPADQVKVRARDRIRIVQMPPTVVEPEPQPAPAAAEGKA